MEKVCISSGNTKMGSIQSVSLPPIITCREGCACAKKCYAAKLARLRSNVRESYQRNLRILQNDPDGYWMQVRAAVATSKYFRFHVSGDIVNEEYLRNMIEIANTYKTTEILCFTKQFEIVNGFLDAGGEIPANLHLIFSAWPGIEMDNKHCLPEAHVVFKGGVTTADLKIAKECGGNCTECAITDGGCWTLKAGEQVVFAEH